MKTKNRLFEVLMAVFLLIIGGVLISSYMKVEMKTVKVGTITTQQNVEGNKENGIRTTYKYLVGTDKGTYEIEPSGLFSSNDFGNLKEGKTYQITTRGYNIPFFGIFPRIIEAREVEK